MTVEERPKPKRPSRRRILNKVERAVLESVAYSDVFDYAVTMSEIRRSLPFEVSLAEVEEALQPGGPLAKHVSQVVLYFTLVGREELALLREQRRETSLKLMQRAQSYGRWIARLPFVRLVAVTGSLAVDNAKDGDDIDYLIVTSPGRVWLTRALTMAVVRFARLRGLTLCPNYLLSESALALQDQDAYTARELMQMRPVVGADAYVALLNANAWVHGFLPNWRPDLLAPELRSQSVLTQVDEMVLGGRLGNALERWFLRRKGDELRALAGDNAEVLFDETVCKGHFDAHRARLETALAERLQVLKARP